jgi:transposase, IS5 family
MAVVTYARREFVVKWFCGGFCGRLLEEHGLGGEILERVKLHLAGEGVRMTMGAIVDVTIIHAPSSTKNREQKRDPKMHQTKKDQE